MAESRFVYVTYIRTTPEKLWFALTDAEFIKQYWFGMHCESEWTAGSSWKLASGDGETALAAPPKLGEGTKINDALVQARDVLTSTGATVRSGSIRPCISRSSSRSPRWPTWPSWSPAQCAPAPAPSASGMMTIVRCSGRGGRSTIWPAWSRRGQSEVEFTTRLMMNTFPVLHVPGWSEAVPSRVARVPSWRSASGSSGSS